MPRKTTKTDLETAIQQAADRFAMEILELVRNATVDELAALTSVQAALDARKTSPGKATATRKRGRPAQAEGAVTTRAATRKRGRPPGASAAKKPRKKRAWPKCTSPGCDKNVYMPSGDKKMCYQHYLEAGGKPSPLVAYKKQQAAEKDAEPAPKKAPSKKKTVIRKAADRKAAAAAKSG